MNNLIDFDFPHTGTKTQKLMSLIETAMKAPNLLPGVSLNYRISGDVIELHIVNTGMFNEDYRLAIINCGLVLSYIHQAIEEQGYVPFIQSFPSMEEPQLIAFIRIEKPLMKDLKSRIAHTGSSCQADLFSLKRVLSGTNAIITEIEGGLEADFLMDHCRQMEIDSNLHYIKSKKLWNLSLRCDKANITKPVGDSRIWLISTSMNNSISWLGVGKIMGKLLLMCREGVFPYQIDINLLENRDFREQLAHEYAISGYLQFIVRVTYYQ